MLIFEVCVFVCSVVVFIIIVCIVGTVVWFLLVDVGFVIVEGDVQFICWVIGIYGVWFGCVLVFVYVQCCIVVVVGDCLIVIVFCIGSVIVGFLE